MTISTKTNQNPWDSKPFDFPSDDGTVCSIHLITIEEKPWFYAKDVCSALGLKNVSQSMRHLEEDESCYIELYFRSTAGINQRRKVLVVNESGLYTLAFRSTKKVARRFQRWVTDTIIPSIREHGGYVKGQESIPEEYKRWMHNHIQNNLMPALRRVDDMTKYSGFKPKHKQEQEKAAAITSVAERYNLPHELVDELATKGLYVVRDKVDKLA